MKVYIKKPSRIIGEFISGIKFLRGLNYSLNRDEILILLIVIRKPGIINWEIREFINRINKQGIKEKRFSKCLEKLKKIKLVREKFFAHNHFCYPTGKCTETITRKLTEMLAGNTPICEACCRKPSVSIHHYLPQKFFGNTPFKIYVCEDCHDELGELVHDKEGISKEEYFIITFDFVMRKKKKRLAES